MTNPVGNIKSTGDYRRVFKAIGYSYAGFRHALRNEAAIREELVGLAILVPVSVFLPVSDLVHLILVLSMMQVVLVEFVNSSIEATVDRISLERHPLAEQAKDLASMAVLIAVLMAGLCWVVIAGPVAMRWIR